MTAVDARRALRLEMRRRRAALDADDQAVAAMAVMTRLARLPILRGPGPVAGYRAVRGEVDVEGFLEGATVVGDEREVRVILEWLESFSGVFGIVEP